MADWKPSLLQQCGAEFIGTFTLVFFGTGAVFVAVLTGALEGLIQVGMVWGLAIALSIYATSAISGTHINPAVTLAMVALRDFPKAKVIPFVFSQLLGAVMTSCVLFFLFGDFLTDFEMTKGIERGKPGSELSAMVFGEYFPNPAIGGVLETDHAKVGVIQAMLAEGIGTAFLVFFVFALTEPRNHHRPDGTLYALFIGLTITILIAVIAPITQAGFNPARDFGPRLVAFFSGWGSVAIPGPRGGFFTVYILSPLVGGLLGGTIYEKVIRPALPDA
ncbi:MAG: MIP family channel protein [Candidatus Omnitrophica bacterium]|nr:MIP family channel protein [Candidatus Omnitrophota bacterium]